MMKFIPATGRKLSIPSTPTEGAVLTGSIRQMGSGVGMKELPQFVEGWRKRCCSGWAK